MLVSYFQGSGLNTACRDVDVRVLIDNVTCSLISRSETEIVCDPNEQYPGTSREATLVVMLTLKAPPITCSRRQFQIMLLFQK